jgi:hypothetical protein
MRVNYDSVLVSTQYCWLVFALCERVCIMLCYVMLCNVCMYTCVVVADEAQTGDRVVLVPYRREFVPKYHSWMEDEAIRDV